MLSILHSVDSEEPWSKMHTTARRRTARNAADMPLSNSPPNISDTDPNSKGLEFIQVDNDRNKPEPTNPKRRLVSIRILPPRDGEIRALTSEQVAQQIMQQANDPQSKMRTTIGLEGILGAFLAPRGIDPGLLAEMLVSLPFQNIIN